MMSSSYSNPYQRVDHSAVFNSLQEDANKCSKSREPITTDDIFKPITELNKFINKATDTDNETVDCNDSLTSSASKTTVIQSTKIPVRKSYPLTTLWTNKRNKRVNPKRSLSENDEEECTSESVVDGVGVGGQLSLRISKNNFPFLLKCLRNEMVKRTAKKLKCTTHGHQSDTTGGRACRKQNKLDLNTQKSSTGSKAVRSQPLRKNFKYSSKTDSPNKHQNSQPRQKQTKDQESACAAPEVATEPTTSKAAIIVKHDNVAGQKITTKQSISQNNIMSINKDQGDGPLPRGSSGAEMQQQQQQQQQGMSSDSPEVNDVNLTKDLGKLSLNHNGVQSSSATTTPTQQKHQKHHHQQQQHSPQSRPSTLATSASTTTTTGEGGGNLKTPRSPKTTTAIPGPETVTPQQHQRQHHHHHHRHHRQQQEQQQQQLEEEEKISPDCKPTPKTPPVTPDSPTTFLDDDLDSVYSYTTTSGRSTMSCEHPFVARNGTTFSGRKMKYVVHCSNYAGQVGAEYLTPTQRAQRQIKRLKELLCVARQDLEQKDSEILRLTREVVELRLFKASLSSPDERSASSDAVTVREAELKTSQDVSPIVDMVDDGPQKSHHHHHHHHHQHQHHSHHGDGGGGGNIHAASESPTSMLHHHQQHLSQSSSHHHHSHHVMHDMQSSFADSGHFEDLTTSSVHSKSSSSCGHSLTHGHGHDQACGGVVVGEGGDLHNDGEASASTIAQYELQRQELIRMYEQRIEDLVRSQDVVTSDMKRSNNDRIEALLQKLAECNTRYADIVPDYEHAKERIRELEKQLEDLQRKLSEHEEKQKQMYLHMYQKGQEAERIARADQALELAYRAPQNNKVSINELLHQLQSTQDELENIRTIYRRLLEAQKNRTHVDPEVTLQFLKSAVYYFLTDKENSQGHLQAIESILEFSEAEKQTINKARNSK